MNKKGEVEVNNGLGPWSLAWKTKNLGKGSG